jgi:hypothetical protein
MGYRLRPFCLWHQFLLSIAESPLVVPDKELTPRDLLRAVLICRTRYLQEPARPSRFRMLWATLRGRSLLKEAESFAKYLRDFDQRPEFHAPQKRSKGGPMPRSSGRGAPPEPLGIAASIIEMFGGGASTEAFAWEMGIGKAYWYSAVHQLHAGADLDFVTPQARHVREVLAEAKSAGKISTEAQLFHILKGFPTTTAGMDMRERMLRAQLERGALTDDAVKRLRDALAAYDEDQRTEVSHGA